MIFPSANSSIKRKRQSSHHAQVSHHCYSFEKVTNLEVLCGYPRTVL
ncbi:hypothetical protein [Azospirillum argentinense]